MLNIQIKRGVQILFVNIFHNGILMVTIYLTVVFKFGTGSN